MYNYQKAVDFLKKCSLNAETLIKDDAFKRFYKECQNYPVVMQQRITEMEQQKLTQSIAKTIARNTPSPDQRLKSKSVVRQPIPPRQRTSSTPKTA